MNEQFQRLNTSAKKIWQTVNTSPASRLALQRLEAQRSNQPRTLYELVENNRDNQCQVHCDHVYALYSLAGEHRRYLNIDYGASSVQRLVDILDFVTNHEQIPPVKVMSFANLLIRLLKIHNDELTQGYPLLQTLRLTIPATILGAAEPRQETQATLKARKAIKPFDAMPIYTFSTDQATWTSIDNNQHHRNMSVAVGRQDMARFSIAGTNFQGLAACTVAPADIIWNFSGTKHVFIVRPSHAFQASIVGRAYLFQAANNSDTLRSWESQGANDGNVRQGTQLLSVTLATLLEITSLASTNSQRGKKKREVDEKGYEVLENMGDVWGRHWGRIIVLSACCMIIILMAVVVGIHVRI